MHTSILTLQSQLEQAKERLKGVEEDIKKNTGRDLSNPRAFKRQLRTDEGPAVKRRLSDVKGRLGDWIDRPRAQTRPLFQRNANDRLRDGDRISAKERLGDIDSGNHQTVTVFSRLSGPPKALEDDDKDKIKITSQVLVQETPSRREVLAAQNPDLSCKARNRRMFGALMGTLQKFRQEENKLKEKEEKKAEVERRVEEAAEREREAAKRQRIELFSTRRQQQTHIRHIEFKIIRLKQLAEWEENKRRLLPFIQTTTNPKIFYLPKKHNEKTSSLLKINQDIVNKEIEKKRAEVHQLIEDSASRAEEPEAKEEDREPEEPEDDDIDKEDLRKSNKRRVIILPKSEKNDSTESSSSSESESESEEEKEKDEESDREKSKSPVSVNEDKDETEKEDNIKMEVDKPKDVEEEEEGEVVAESSPKEVKEEKEQAT